MKKILVTLPNSIAGTLILKGFRQGFKANGCCVYELDLRDLTLSDVEKIKPDIIFGYDYGFLFSDDEDLKKYIKKYAKQNDVKFVHYFADEPDGRFAYVNKKELFNEFKKFVKAYDVTNFVWDKNFTSEFKNSYFLPLGVNYKAYRVEEDFNTERYDISFVGRPLTDKRQEYLAALVKVFGNKLNIFSYENHFLQSLDDMKKKKLLNDEELEVYKNTYRGFLKTEKDIASVYFNSKVNINITLQGKSGLNYRVFEALASRGFLITDCFDDVEEFFEVSRELETYKNIDEMMDKIKFYLKHQFIAQKIALSGFAAAAKKHSYSVRAMKILEKIK